MAVSQDIKSAQLGSPQNRSMQLPRTIASTTTIAPDTKLTFVSGTIDIATITPPEDGYHELYFQFTDASPGDLLTTGNISVGSTTVAQYSIVLALFDPISAKYKIARLT